MPQPLTPLEVASGIPFGAEPATGAAPEPAGPTPFDALVEVVAAECEHGRLAVAFSGGRDSSLLLAAAAEASRRYGQPAPIAVTMRFPGIAEADEDDWQELVIGHVGGIDDWVRVEPGDELDIGGPLAMSGVEHHGLLYPANAHSAVPLARAAQGTTILQGVGGDQLFQRTRWRQRSEVLARRRRARPSDVGTVLLGAAPAPIRAQILRRRGYEEPLAWLTPAANAERARRLGEAHDPPRRDHSTLGLARSREITHSVHAIQALSADHGARAAAPLVAPGFLAALARAGGRHGWGNRTQAMEAIAGDRLPRALNARHRKATFGGVFFGPAMRAATESWDGSGLDPALVDAQALRTEMTKEVPTFLSLLLVQQICLTVFRKAHSDASSGHERTEGQ